MLWLVLLACLAVVRSECPNGCSSHGKCGAYDMCQCYRNWMANDCSERVCQFGLAHVDTPKGDLDASSGALTGPDTTVVQNDAMYPYGTSEQYPSMYDSDQNVMKNSAHWYRECSNKGICDRSSGLCQCFEGYSGSSCQRASCPVTNGAVCSGHGTCKDIKTLAAEQSGNVYNLWDEHTTMGCDCDAGFSGPDCSLKTCKAGADPLYYDDFRNVRYSNWTVQFYTMAANEYVYGNYSLIFTDYYGEDWQTGPIDINSNCMAITEALESLPNNVIPEGSVRCFKTEEGLHNKFAYDGSTTDSLHGSKEGDPIYDLNMYIVTKYVLAFPANVGKLEPLKVNRHLDGYRPTLYTKSMPSTLGWHIFPNGFAGEDIDYVNDECVGVLASLSSGGTTHYLAGLDSFETKRLMACLGDSNGVDSDNINTYNWDYGNWMNPHLIKLVEATQDTYTQYVRPDGTVYKVQDVYDTNGGLTQDTQMNDFPVTKLCTNGRSWVTYKGGASLKVTTTEGQATIGQAATNSLNGVVWDPVSGSYTGTSGFFNIGQQGYCANVNPPGFYAVLYYDDCSFQPTMNSRGYGSAPSFCDSGYPFRLLTRAATDYGSNTLFHIYTTKGHLQQVNQNSGMYTTDLAASATNQMRSYHSNVVHFANVTENYKTSGVYSSTQTFMGQVDCETTTLGTNGALDCIDRGDMVMFLNLGVKDPTGTSSTGADNGVLTNGVTSLAALYDYNNNPLLLNSYSLKDSLQTGLTHGKCFTGTTAGGVTYGYVNYATSGQKWLCPMSGAYLPTAASLLSNPVYPNIYTVKKIARNPKDYSLIGDRDPASDAFKESMRNTAVLDFALNGKFSYTPNYRIGQAAYNTVNPPSTATIYKFYPPTGYEYVGACSNRGVCNDVTGICQCFAGYTGDDCGHVNSLAM